MILRLEWYKINNSRVRVIIFNFEFRGSRDFVYLVIAPAPKSKSRVLYNCHVGIASERLCNLCVLAVACIAASGGVLAAAIWWHILTRLRRLCVQPTPHKVSACACFTL